MREENNIWNNVPNGWYICGGMVIPPPNHRNFPKL